MKVATRQDAWKEVNKIFPTDYEKDESASQRAGYDIYRHPTLNYYNRICDLGVRLKVLTGEYGENVTNIWIEAEDEEKAEKTVSLPEYEAANKDNFYEWYPATKHFDALIRDLPERIWLE